MIGNGNVALDVARMLALTPEELALTDTADHALEALSKSAIEEIVFGEPLRPGGNRDFEEVEGDAPIGIERVGDQAVEPLPRHTARRHVVDQPGEIVGKRARRGRALRHQRNAAGAAQFRSGGPFGHELGEQETPLQSVERRAQRQRVGGNLSCCGFGKCDFVFVNIADSDNAR